MPFRLKRSRRVSARAKLVALVLAASVAVAATALVIVGGILLAPVLLLIVMPVLIDLFSRRRTPVGAPQPLPSPAE
jgi:Cu/Ag efflux pump CusA